MILRTDAIVLQSRKFRESSRIVTLFTREHGKMGVVARGASRGKNPTGAALQPMSFVSAMIYTKEGRELQNLTNADSIERLSGLTDTLERMTAGLTIVELVNASVHDADRNDHLFDALLHSLRALNAGVGNEISIVLWFMIRLASALGYAVRIDGCGVCDEAVNVGEQNVAYSLSDGAPLCSEHRESVSSRQLSLQAFGLLGALANADAVTAAATVVDTRCSSELLDVLNAFIRYHVDGMRRLKVGDISARLLGATPDIVF